MQKWAGVETLQKGQKKYRQESTKICQETYKRDWKINSYTG